MNKQRLEEIFTEKFNLENWREILTAVFGVTNLYQTPKPITLNSNDVAESAFELGSFDTTDDRVIGLYRVNLNNNARIERNRVGLRETLRSIYKFDVDGALVVFVQDDKWRLSFISEIRTLDDEGRIIKEATEPKRYTYLLGLGEKVKTSAIRLSKIAGKPLTLEDIREAFSVEALNEEFYKIVREYFYQLVGGNVGKGRAMKTYQKLLKLPCAETKENERYFREFAVRLIGRTIFCWFLKVKKSKAGISLLPEELLSVEAVNNNRDYYHNILERLFFQTLNTPMEQRRGDLPNGCEIIPFLNGGLFEDQVDDFYKPHKENGINQNLNTLVIPDEWFAGFFGEISHYNFTADENSPVDIEFSIDPEMLGRIFENLLAEIDPDTGESARKATGSFYTPREIVSYMVDESLIYYLKAKLETETKGFGFQAFGEQQTTMFGNEARIQQKFEIPLENNRWKSEPGAVATGLTDKGGNPTVIKGAKDSNENKTDPLETALRELFSHGKNEHQFNETETEILIKAIDDCKVLDPACGSGAFPIGVLQRLVFLLEKLDKDNKKWELWQKEKAIEETKKAFEEGDKTGRDARLKEISDAFEKDSSGYGRKLFLIERCIYGVDIQPIAAEISKLRCFLTLVVDDTVDERAGNRGVRHLPNLEFKFVTADALLKLPQSSLFNSDTQLKELEKIRTEYLQSYGEKKESLKEDFKKLQGEILDTQTEASGDMQDERAIKLGGWKPFEHEKTDWFDPLWMFGVKDFDIVIGNPPYLESRNPSFSNKQKDNLQNAVKQRWGEDSKFITRGADLLVYFFESGLTLINERNGQLVFLTQNSWLSTQYGQKLQLFLLKKTSVKGIIDSDFKYFDNKSGPNINTVITTFVGREAKTDSTLTFARFHDDFTKLNSSIFNYKSSELQKSIVNIKRYLHSDKNIKEIKWGILLSAQEDIFFKLIHNLKEKAEKISEIQPQLSIGQGLNLPKNYLVSKEKIEEFQLDNNCLIPILSSDDGAPFYLNSTTLYLIDKKRIDKEIQGLLRKANIYTFDTRSTRKKAPTLILPRGIGRHFCAFNDCNAFSTSYVDVYDLCDELTNEVKLNLWVSLNSSVCWLWREISGRKNLGGGMLKAEAIDLNPLQIYMDFNNYDFVKSIFDKLSSRQALDIITEIDSPEHQMIDDLVASYLGLTKKENKDIVDLLKSKVNERSEKAQSHR